MTTTRESTCTIELGGSDASTVELQGSNAGPDKGLFAHAQSQVAACSKRFKPRATMMVLAAISTATYFHEVQTSLDGGIISDCFSGLNIQFCIRTRARLVLRATATGAGCGELALDSIRPQEHRVETMLTVAGVHTHARARSAFRRRGSGPAAARAARDRWLRAGARRQLCARRGAWRRLGRICAPP